MGYMWRTMRARNGRDDDALGLSDANKLKFVPLNVKRQ
jgi:hypothetical protein